MKFGLSIIAFLVFSSLGGYLHASESDSNEICVEKLTSGLPGSLNQLSQAVKRWSEADVTLRKSEDVQTAMNSLHERLKKSRSAKLLFRHLPELTEALLAVQDFELQNSIQKSEIRSLLTSKLKSAIQAVEVSEDIKREALVKLWTPYAKEVRSLDEATSGIYYFLKRMASGEELRLESLDRVEESFTALSLQKDLQAVFEPNFNPEVLLSKDLASYRKALLSIDLAGNVLEWSGFDNMTTAHRSPRNRFFGFGHIPDSELRPNIFAMRTEIRALDFTKFLERFPTRKMSGEDVFMLGANTELEKAVVKSVHANSKFKRDLFESIHPDWIKDEKMKSWISFASGKEVRAKLQALNSETDKTQQIFARYLRERTGLSLADIKVDPHLIDYYADDVLAVLQRLSVESGNALKTPELRELQGPTLRAAFFSRRPTELNLGRKTGDCTSFKSSNFANSLRWFSTPVGQVMTFTYGKRFLAKMHLVLFESSNGPLLAVDAFELNPQAEPGEALHELYASQFDNMISQIRELGQRLGRRVLISPVTNSIYNANQINKNPISKDAEVLLAASHIDFDHAKVRSFMETQSGLKIPPSAKSGKNYDNELFLQSFVWTDDNKADEHLDLVETKEYKAAIQLKNDDNAKLVEEVSKKYADWVRSSRRLGNTVSASRFHDLPSADTKLVQLEKMLLKAIDEEGLGHELEKAQEATNAKAAIRATKILAANLASLSDDFVRDNLERIYGSGGEALIRDEELVDQFLAHRLFFLTFFRRYENAAAKAVNRFGPSRWVPVETIHEIK